MARKRFLRCIRRACIFRCVCLHSCFGFPHCCRAELTKGPHGTPPKVRPTAGGAGVAGGAHAAHGLEQLEFLRRPRDRQGHSRCRRSACGYWHERCRLHLRQYRRHLGGRPRRRWRAALERKVPRHESTRRLCALEGAQAWHLFIAGAKDLRGLCRFARS